MIEILYASELGGGPGKLLTAARLSTVLEARGHAVHLALGDLVAAQQVPTLFGRPLLQAPRAPLRRPESPPRDYPELLAHCGLDDAATVTGLVSAWLALIDATRAELVVADHSPLAMLAADIRGVPACAVGTGYGVPPDVSPLPSILPWRPDAAPDGRAGAAVLDAFAQASTRLGGRAPTSIGALFAAQRCRLFTLPEFDHYGLRAGDACAGLVAPQAPGDEAFPARFPDREGPRTLVYRPPGFGDFDALVGCLARTGWPCLVVAPGLDPRRAEMLAAPGLRFETRPIDLRTVWAQADRALVHGGHGTTAGAVLAGLPSVVVPMRVEHALLGHRLQARHLAGLLFDPREPSALERAFEEQHSDRCRDASSALAASRAACDGDANLPALAEWIEGRAGP